MKKALELFAKRFSPPGRKPGGGISIASLTGAGDAFLAGWLAADFLGLSVAERLAKATAVASARCEVDRPWNIDLGRVSSFESELLPQVENFLD